MEEVDNKTIGDVNQLKLDDELRNSTHSNDVITAMKKHMKGLKDPTIWSKKLSYVNNIKY